MGDDSDADDGGVRKKLTAKDAMSTLYNRFFR